MTSPSALPATSSVPARFVGVDPHAVAALAAVFESDDVMEPPAPLPPLWHWAALSRPVATSDLRPDGHPHDLELTGPEGFPRRMFGGGEVRLDGQLVIGSRVRVTRAVSPLVRKDGRSGSFYATTATTRIADDSGVVRIEDRQDILFRPGTAAVAGPPPQRSAWPLVGPPLTPSGEGVWCYRTDPALLMRFSAATSNAHRIHYDWPYATAVEGYPDLVVQGPLTVLSALEAFRRLHSDRHIVSVRHRGLSPLFVGGEARIVMTPVALDRQGIRHDAAAGIAATELSVEGLDRDADNPVYARVHIVHHPAPSVASKENRHA